MNKQSKCSTGAARRIKANGMFHAELREIRNKFILHYRISCSATKFNTNLTAENSAQRALYSVLIVELRKI
jgi:hypothetical protein